MASGGTTTAWKEAHREEAEAALQVFPNLTYLKMGPPKKKALSENLDLSMFDVLNIFHHCWFLSVDSLRAQALSAQKAKDGNIIWV
jgi:hypothetical protein